jgi:predicted dehydrogenase
VTQPLRVGLVGVGWGALVQGPAFRAVDGYELAAVCARRQERADEAARRLGVTDATSDWESFVRRDDLDVISVATPAELHRDMTLAALSAGKHVLCEKPLAATAADAEAMCRAADEAGRSTAICFELRWQPVRVTVSDLVQQGVVGTPYFVRMAQSAHYWHPSRPLQALWMYDADAGGGYLANMVVHDIDWVCSLFGDPVAVCADVRTSVPVRDLPDGGRLDVTADDTTALLLRLDSGALAVLTTSVVGVHTSGYRFEAFGANGTVLAEAGRAEGTVRAGQVGSDGLAEQPLTAPVAERLRDLPASGSSAAIRAMAALLQEWLPAFTRATTRAPSFRDGLRAQRVIEAARRSSAGDGWVPVAG